MTRLMLWPSALRKLVIFAALPFDRSNNGNIDKVKHRFMLMAKTLENEASKGLHPMYN